MTRLLWPLLALPLLAASPEQDIRRVLDDQVAAWNRGDIPGFMEGYDKSEATTFVSSTITKGHADVLANYRALLDVKKIVPEELDKISGESKPKAATKPKVAKPAETKQ